MSDSPIFIGGMNRSGTSLMRQLIGSHSQVAMPPTEFGFFSRFPQTTSRLSRSNFERSLSALLECEKIAEWDLPADRLMDESRSREPSYRNLFRLFIDAYRVWEKSASAKRRHTTNTT